MKVTTAGISGADFCGRTNRTIQKAVDAVYLQGGGEVHILPGTYIMYDSLHLRTGVDIVGSGDKTVLKKTRGFSTLFAADSGYGHFDVSVMHPEQFPPGTGIHISDEMGKGFYGTVATVLWRDRNVLGISRMLNHDYARCRKATVRSVFPIISGYTVDNVLIKNLAIDGNRAQNGYIDGCRGGGIFLLGSRNIKINGVLVSNYNGDGISFQQTQNVRISGCRLTGNAGHGLHPGSGSVGAIIEHCEISRNGCDGIFFCLRVTYCLVERCLITGNKGDGISIGARDTDHLIRANRIVANRKCAVYFRTADLPMGAHRNVLEENDIGNNCTEGRNAEILIENVAHDVHICKNLFSGSPRKPYIIAGEECKNIFAFGNRKAGEPVGPMDVKGPIAFQNPARKLKVGPEHATRKAVRHLVLGIDNEELVRFGKKASAVIL
jgi:hypothetical protein